VKDVDGTGTIDIGDLEIFRKRVKDNEPTGKIGLKFKEYDPETPPDKRKIEVSFIEPQGPAAKTDIKVGDVFTSVDGVDVTGANIGNANMILRAPPGTKVSIGLARGVTIQIVLAPP
jgi:C-terminal processing protease CtpA/Prc